MSKKDLVMQLARAFDSNPLISIRGTIELKRGEKANPDTYIDIINITDQRECLPTLVRENVPTVSRLKTLQSLLNRVGYQSYGDIGYTIAIAIETKQKIREIK